jgi:hypothetical protein
VSPVHWSVHWGGKGPSSVSQSVAVWHSTDPPSPKQTHGPYAVPSTLQTWLEKQPPGPLHAIDCPGMQASAEPSFEQEHAS